jgi:hypothetical protein
LGRSAWGAGEEARTEGISSEHHAILVLDGQHRGTSRNGIPAAPAMIECDLCKRKRWRDWGGGSLYTLCGKCERDEMERGRTGSSCWGP